MERATPEGVKLLAQVGVYPTTEERSPGRSSADRGVEWGSGEAEALGLKEVEGVDVPEHDGFHLFDAAHEQATQAVVPHVGVRPLGGEALAIDGLAPLAGHALAPGDGPRSVAALG